MSDFITPDTTTAMMQAGNVQMQSLQSRMKEGGNMKEIEHAAQEFEAVFVAEMLKPMFEGIDVDPMFGGGQGEDVFRSMLVEEYGKKIAETGGIGLADHVKAELIRIQQSQAANNR